MSNLNTTISPNIYRNNWEDLPKELLVIIGKHLESRIDVFTFRAVSTSWRSAVSFSYRQNQSSLTLPPPINATAVLSPVTICRLEHQTQGVACLVKVVESTSGELRLRNPLSSDLPIRQYPGNNNNIRKSLNLLDFRLIELARGYRLNFTTIPTGSTITKAVLFYGCGILALFDSRELGSRNLVQYAPLLCGFGHLKNLVESAGHFYVVDSYLEEEEEAMFEEPRVGLCGRRTVNMKVYRLDEEWGTWVDVDSLGNRVFVLGKDVCFSVSVDDFPSCQGNCIYFLDPVLEFVNVRRTIKRFVGRVFRFDNRSIKMVECFPTYKRLFSPSMNNLPLSISA
ncbi:hypothetical protein SOVF_087790 [Spinacia oleracea]|nr:hypothetical protein SOVF_087790 [Spinacia oleracea]